MKIKLPVNLELFQVEEEKKKNIKFNYFFF